MECGTGGGWPCLAPPAGGNCKKSENGIVEQLWSLGYLWVLFGTLSRCCLHSEPPFPPCAASAGYWVAMTAGDESSPSGPSLGPGGRALF